MELKQGGVGGPTGVARFDELIVGTRRFARWAQAVERRGFKVTVRKPEEMSVDEAACIRPFAEVESQGEQTFRYEIAVNPAIFRYIDLRHETRHVQQLTRAEDAGIKHLFSKHLRTAAERDAWLMEKALGERHGFAPSYLVFVEARLQDYSVRDDYGAFADKYRRSPNLQKFVGLLQSFQWS